MGQPTDGDDRVPEQRDPGRSPADAPDEDVPYQPPVRAWEEPATSPSDAAPAEPTGSDEPVDAADEPDATRAAPDQPQPEQPQPDESQPDQPGTPGPADAAPEPSESSSPAAATPPSGASSPEPEESEVPYEPSVRAWERPRQVGTVRAPGGAPAAPTEAIPAVSSTSAGSSTSPSSADGATGSRSGGIGATLGGLLGDGAPSRTPKVLLGVLTGLVVLAGLYVGAQWMVADTVPKGTTVAGVDVGGLTAPEAATALDEGLGPRAAEPLTVRAGDATSTIDPAESGLRLDSAKSVEDLTGFTLDPSRLLEHLVGGDEVAPAVTVDRGALTATVNGVAESLATEPVDGSVRFTDGEAVATEAVAGTQVVVASADDAIVDAWLVSEGPVDLPTESVDPAIDQADTDAALVEAREIVSGPVTVQVDAQNPELPARVLARSTSFAAQDGELVARFDGDRLTSAIVERTNDLLREPNDAHFEFSDGRPVIVGGETGTTLDPQQVAEAVGGAARAAERSTQVELVESDPEDSRASLEELGVQEVVSEFSTPLTAEPIRTKNLVRGAELVNGTLVRPDETFSLVDTLSPIEESNGYFAAGVVSNGVHVDAVGGGLSQMATTTYNAGFFAGFDDVEHRQHSYWFSRYPAGREATIYVGAIDMKFRNDTPYGALLQSYVSGGRLHVKVWSTKYYDVEASDSGKQDVVPVSTVNKSGDPDCEPYSGGEAGFAITVYRKVYHDGDLVKDESDFWRYKPDDAVSCEPEKDSEKKDGGD
ncbi:VanW family protein [Isoptericola sp. b408]|uniref:VanW family protein n=1 Tax=Isoptericola sp. b408 TaxID=3064653 RepID=UPI002712C190|nr:VanW family protein [Isoptericola sp. b408]MDO8151643.1 VanW family protein [Isoptericola sp. b408]